MKLEINKEVIASLKLPKNRNLFFKNLLKEYKQPLYWHIRKIVYNHDDADDVLQNTFIKVHENIAKFRQDSKIYTWLYRIATNEALQFIEKRKRKMRINDAEYNEIEVNKLQADSYFDGDAFSIEFQKALSKLPKKQRLVFNMKYFDEMKYEEISDILDVTVGSLKASYHHAVNKVKDYVKENSF